LARLKSLIEYALAQIRQVNLNQINTTALRQEIKTNKILQRQRKHNKEKKTKNM